MATSPTLLGSVEVRESTDIYPSPLPRQYSFLAKPPINQRINIRHPAYEPESDLLFTLYAWDHSKGGLQYGLVHNACAVVAANRRDGYLSKARDGGRIHASRTDILGAGDYFYHVPRAESENSDEKPNCYAIVPSFQDWKFPSSLPEEFNDLYNTESAFYTTQQSAMTAAVRTRDITCRITNHHTDTQVAHLCPGHEREWFLRNSMAMWNTDLTLDPDNLLDDLSNMILLRSDLNAAFDDHQFVLYPKADDGYVVHMLEPTLDIGQLYHNVKIHPLLQCNPRFLYARFAWALFPSLAGFLSKPGVSRCLLLARTSERGVEWVEEEVAKPEELRAKISASRSRRPKKRQRATDVNPHEDAETDGLPEISPKRQCRSISMTADREKATSAGLEDSVLIHQPESTTRACEDELARMEWEEDMELQRRHIDLTSSAMPPSWYPGWRQIQRLKTKWITLGRPKDYPDRQPGAGIGRCLSNEGVVGQVRGFYEAMGSDCTDDDDTI